MLKFMSLKESIVTDRIPQHVAIIMDGNGRWAKKRGNQRIFGHRNGVNAVRAVTEAAGELGVKYLTLYAFSTENWNRPRTEIDALMSLLVSTINSETDTLLKNGVCLKTIGDMESLPSGVATKLKEAIAKTSGCNGLNLVLALNYSSRWEITNAITKIAQSVADGKLLPSDITAETVSASLCTGGIPDPELIIRTSGEYRLSNFLLWQAAYSEFYFTEVLWPDFDKEEFYRAVIDYQKRERRFGKISEQL